MVELKVLFVDDEPDILEQAKIFLEKEVEGMNIETAISAEKALEMLEESDYDAIVSDYLMSEMDGIEFLKTPRDKDDDIPFIILTGRGREEVAMKSLNLGANRYFQKGGDPRSQYGVLAQTIVQEVTRRRTEASYRTIFETTGTATMIVEEDTTISVANEEFEELSGYPKEEIEGKKSWTEFVTEEDLKRMKEYHRLRREDPDAAPTTYEFQFVDREGDVKDILLNISMIQNAKKSIASLLDITERKRKEKELDERKRFAEALIESMKDGFSILDSDGVHLEVNESLCQMTGFAREELIGTGPPHPYWPEEEHESIGKAFRKTLRGEFEEFELTFKRKNGERFPVIVSPSMIKDENGKIISYFATIKDITERKKAEEREEFLHSLLRHDLRNKVQIAQGYHELLQELDLPEGGKNT